MVSWPPSIVTVAASPEVLEIATANWKLGLTSWLVWVA